MRNLHIQIQRDDAWLIAQALEEPSVITQGRTLDEIVKNVREVVQLMFDETNVQLELLVPSGTFVGSRKPRPRSRKRRPAKAA
jgi:predicted RNase H-like HicB family nuclease